MSKIHAKFPHSIGFAVIIAFSSSEFGLWKIWLGYEVLKVLSHIGYEATKTTDKKVKKPSDPRSFELIRLAYRRVCD